MKTFLIVSVLGTVWGYGPQVGMPSGEVISVTEVPGREGCAAVMAQVVTLRHYSYVVYKGIKNDDGTKKAAGKISAVCLQVDEQGIGRYNALYADGKWQW
jgi:hypothetical protein